MEENSQSPDGQAGSGSEPTKPDSTDVLKKLEFFENEAKAAFKVRDELKAKLKALEDAEEMKKGNYEKLLADRNAEFEQLKAEADELKQTKEEFDSFQKVMKEELLNELPEGHKVIAGELSLEKLREYVKLNKSTTPGMDTARAGGQGTVDTSGKDWDSLTMKERDEIATNNPQRYKEIYKKKFGRLPN